MISFANAFFLIFEMLNLLKLWITCEKFGEKWVKIVEKKVKKDFKIKVLLKKGSILLKIIA